VPKLTDPNTLEEGQGNAAPTIVDVRSPDEYASGHVSGAVNIPIDELEARSAEIPQNRPVVTYCNMYHPGSSRGERAADLLESLGFRARALNGGYPAWLNATEKDKPE
jgi:rhodanese-related sulfurtransferase